MTIYTTVLYKYTKSFKIDELTFVQQYACAKQNILGVFS